MNNKAGHIVIMSHLQLIKRRVDLRVAHAVLGTNYETGDS